MEEAAATKEVATARAATLSVVDKAEPPLNPNQPNQSKKTTQNPEGGIGRAHAWATDCIGNKAGHT